MFKNSDVKIHSISEAKKNLSKIIKEATETEEPAFISKHNKPEAVVLSNAVYQELIEKYQELEDQIFYNELHNQVLEGSKELLPSKEVIETNKDINQFYSMSDKELFD